MVEIDLVVGTLGRARGLSGEMFVDLRTDSPFDRFRPGAPVHAGTRTLTVKNFTLKGVRGLLRFDEIDNRTAAEALTGTQLHVRVNPAETTNEEGVYFDHQLVGLSVATDQDRVIGEVVRVEHLGFQDMLVVGVAGAERLVPFVDDLVPEVDLDAGRVVVRAIPGLLEDER